MTLERCLRRIGSLAVCSALLIVLTILPGCLFQNDPIAILASSQISGPAPLDIEFDISYVFNALVIFPVY